MSNFERTKMMAGRLATIGALAASIGLGACSSVVYDSNPEGPASQVEEKPDFASVTVQNLLATSIRWAVEQYPPPAGEGEGWFAVNLPRALTRAQYIDVAERIGVQAAPITPELAYLPTYHVGWVWMRGDRARVDVIRPVYVLSRNGEPISQTITLHLRRHWASWRVERTQPWEPGVVDLPPVYYLPPEEPPPGEPVAPHDAAPAEEASVADAARSDPGAVEGTTRALE